MPEYTFDVFRKTRYRFTVQADGADEAEEQLWDIARDFDDWEPEDDEAEATIAFVRELDDEGNPLD